MAADNFWNNREKAQGMIDEANVLRKKIDPLLKAERQLDDFKVMTELAESEPETEQVKHQTQMDREMTAFIKDLDKLELKVFHTGPHDKNNCILSINAGAGGTVVDCDHFHASARRRASSALASASPSFSGFLPPARAIVGRPVNTAAHQPARAVPTFPRSLF